MFRQGLQCGDSRAAQERACFGHSCDVRRTTFADADAAGKGRRPALSIVVLYHPTKNNAEKPDSPRIAMPCSADVQSSTQGAAGIVGFSPKPRGRDADHSTEKLPGVSGIFQRHAGKYLRNEPTDMWV